MLGYVYTTDRRLPVTDPAGKEPPLTMRTDFAVKIGARTVLIHFGDLPAPLQESVKEQGMGLVQIAVDDERKLVLEKVLSGLDIPMTIDHAEFRPPEDGGPARWIVTLGTIHLTSDRGAFYLVPSDADRDLCAFIRERWGRPIIRY
jgi:hypothetical protein